MRVLIAAVVLGLASGQAAASDATGTMKQWGTVDVTLQAFGFRGGAVGAVLLLKNNTEKPENISSLMQFQMLSDEGDKGDFDWGSKCDGTIPPSGVMKCILTYTFAKPPNGVSLQVGAGFEGDPVYFNLVKQ